MTSYRVLLASVPATAVLLTACGSSATTASSPDDYISAQAISAALVSHQIECVNFTPDPRVLGAQEMAYCTNAGTPVQIIMWSSADQRTQLRAATAALASGLNVDGPKWSVNVKTRKLATAVQVALGGSIT